MFPVDLQRFAESRSTNIPTRKRPRSLLCLDRCPCTSLIACSNPGRRGQTHKIPFCVYWATSEGDNLVSLRDRCWCCTHSTLPFSPDLGNALTSSGSTDTSRRPPHTFGCPRCDHKWCGSLQNNTVAVAQCFWGPGRTTHLPTRPFPCDREYSRQSLLHVNVSHTSLLS